LEHLSFLPLAGKGIAEERRSALIGIISYQNVSIPLRGKALRKEWHIYLCSSTTLLFPSPCGERHCGSIETGAAVKFQYEQQILVSIPLRGKALRKKILLPEGYKNYFRFPSPCGERHCGSLTSNMITLNALAVSIPLRGKALRKFFRIQIHLN
jgi:hypothetical protein